MNQRTIIPHKIKIPEQNNQTPSKIHHDLEKEKKTKSEKAYHGKEVRESLNQSGRFSEALLKRITKIVSRVGGDDENGGSNTGETNCEN